MAIDIQINLGDTIAAMRREFQDLQHPEFDRAVSRAMNRTATAAKTQSSREIRKTYKIGARVISGSMSLRRSNPATLEASVWAEGKPLPALAFQARQTLKGVSINVKGARKTLQRAWIGQFRSGHKGVFARADTSKGYEGGDFLWRTVRLKSTGKDLPIAEVRSIGVPRAFSNQAVIRALEDKSATTFPRVLLHELRRRSGG